MPQIMANSAPNEVMLKDENNSLSNNELAYGESKSLSNIAKPFGDATTSPKTVIAREIKTVSSNAVLAHGRFLNVTEQNDTEIYYPLQYYNKKYIILQYIEELFIIIKINIT